MARSRCEDLSMDDPLGAQHDESLCTRNGSAPLVPEQRDSVMKVDSPAQTWFPSEPL